MIPAVVWMDIQVNGRMAEIRAHGIRTLNGPILSATWLGTCILRIRIIVCRAERISYSSSKNRSSIKYGKEIEAEIFIRYPFSQRENLDVE